MIACVQLLKQNIAATHTHIGGLGSCAALARALPHSGQSSTEAEQAQEDCASCALARPHMSASTSGLLKRYICNRKPLVVAHWPPDAP